MARGVDNAISWDIHNVLYTDWQNRNFDNAVLQKIDAHTLALATLESRHNPIYSLLLLKVSALNQWKANDIQLNNCIMYSRENDIANLRIPALAALRQFRNDLSIRRPYSNRDIIEELQLARARYQGQFDSVFVYTSDQVEHDQREYLSFFVLNRTFLTDSISADQNASNFKAAIFCHFLVHTPFLYIRNPRLNYKQDQSWKFPIFLKIVEDDITVKYTPKSDWSVMDKRLLCPLVISEVVSQKNEEDKQRMLMQAIAAVRIGQHFTDPEVEFQKWFFMVAIYLTAELKAHGYILVSEGGLDPKVHIVLKTFNLKNNDEANRFFLEMLNIRDKAVRMSENFRIEDELERTLLSLAEDAKNLKSLHSEDGRAGRGNNSEVGGQNNNFNPSNNNANTDARNRGFDDEGYGDMYGVFQAPEVYYV